MLIIEKNRFITFNIKRRHLCLLFKVSDVNDNVPKFELPDYQAHNVREDIAIGTPILMALCPYPYCLCLPFLSIQCAPPRGPIGTPILMASCPISLWPLSPLWRCKRRELVIGISTESTPPSPSFLPFTVRHKHTCVMLTNHIHTKKVKILSSCMWSGPCES